MKKWELKSLIEKVKIFTKNKNNLLILVLAGILLMIIAWPVKKDTSNNNDSYKNDTDETLSIVGGQLGHTNNDAGSTTGNIDKDIDISNSADVQNYLQYEAIYLSAMEKKVSSILSEVEGAGKVEVMLTLEASIEKVVEKDTPINRANTSEDDGEGGTRMINSVDMGEETVYSKDGNVSEPFIVKTISPRLKGVLVLAEGAGVGETTRNLSEAVQVLFGIEANRIKVIKMECIEGKIE